MTFFPRCKPSGLAPFLLLAAALAGSGCSGSPTLTAPSQNYNSRVGLIVIHHTSANFADSLRILTVPSDRPVSSHYLIPDPSDASYDRDELEIFRLVPESERAWHAGTSYWGGRTALNDQSIGIEIVNQTYCRNDGVAADEAPARICFYPDFPESQMQLVIELLTDLQARYPDIKPVNYVGHSDIAPSRKIDPGPRFPWERLYQLGFGAWFDDETVVRYWQRFRLQPLPLVNIQRALNAYGYGLEPTGELDQRTRDVLRAFQLHFRPSLVDSEPNLDTVAILFALIEKYFPERLEELLTVEPVEPVDPPEVEPLPADEAVPAAAG